MGMKYTQVRADTFETLQINAGIILNEFDPSDGSYDRTDIIGATTGGASFDSGAEFMDFGEDVDNVPNNTYQLKRLTRYSPILSGTFVTVDGPLAKRLIASAEFASATGKITPNTTLAAADFGDIWLVGDYSDKNGSTNGGFIAIHIKHALSTGGFQWQSTKDGKGNFAFEFTGHYDLENIDDAPFEMYVRAGTAEPVTGAGA